MIIVRLISLPTTTKGIVVKDENDDYNIYLNCNLSCDAQYEAYQHELFHIMNGDFASQNSVKEKEKNVCQAGQTSIG